MLPAGVEQMNEAFDAKRHDDFDLLARAYAALGDSYLQSDRPKDALFAFLHIDLLYPQVNEAHAKALHELSKLWEIAGYADRADEAAEKLARQYPRSRYSTP